MRSIKWILEILGIIFLIYLITYNQQKVTFTVIYKHLIIPDIPIIALCFIFLLIGLIIGAIMYFISYIKFKLKINSLNKEIQHLSTLNSNNIKKETI